MLEHYDEILLEQYMTAQNMSKSERDNCMQYIMNLKDISNSIFCVVDGAPSKYNINYMNFIKTIDGIIFDGVLENDIETRWIDGTIIFEDSKVVVNSTFNRISILANDDEREYSCIDVFRCENDEFVRESEYLNIDNNFIDKVYFFDEELNNFYMKRIGKEKLIRRKKAF